MIEHTPGEMNVTAKMDGFFVVPRQAGSIKDVGGNCRLIEKAHEAPHECSDRDCPGDVNQRKLAAFDGLLAACKRAKELYDYLALGPFGAAAKYGPDHDYERISDEECLDTRGALEDALAKAQE